MFELVLHHNYNIGEAIDMTDHENDGQVSGAIAAPGVAKMALEFDGVDDRVDVAASESLAELRAVRVSARVWLDSIGQRRNIAEGYLSFAFFVEANGSLYGTVYDGTGWHGPVSPPNTVPLQSWVTLTFVYDGISSSALYVDHQVVAESHAHLGPVLGVQAPHGLAIGAWPNSNYYMFKGRIDDLKIWRYDPESIKRLIFGRPLSGETWDAWGAALSCLLGTEDDRLIGCLASLSHLVERAIHDIRFENPAVVWAQLEFAKAFIPLFMEDPASPEMESLIDSHIAFLAKEVPVSTWLHLFDANHRLEQGGGCGWMTELCNIDPCALDPGLAAFATYVDQAIENHVLTPYVPVHLWPRRIQSC